MSVKRYNVVPWDRYRVDALPRDGGAWVRYDDHLAEVERLRYVLHRLEQAASELSNHDKTPGFRRTHAHWSRLHEGIGHARAALAAVSAEGGEA